MSNSLASYREKKFDFKLLLKKKCTFLFNPWSDFYFGLALIVVGFAWCGYGLAANSFTSAFNWDYSHQYLPFAYDYVSSWRTFFATGEFPLYDSILFLGGDNIGSNTYYGLFDPFVIVMSIFPSSWIPFLYAISTIIKITLTAFFAKSYLSYMHISKGASRFGSLAIAFSGYLNFMVGFPTFVSAITYVPLILLGIEKTIRECKIGNLVFGLFLLELSCFLLLVPMCIFGVIYALWRYFQTIKDRNALVSTKVILLGICGFALGILLGSFALFPSLRQSSLSGRTSSIGSAYFNSLKQSLIGKDSFAFFSLLFEEVGDNPGRELMGLVSFFFPTGGFQTLPLIVGSSSTYDAWTASIFCYTPFIFLFFSSLLISIKERRFDHIIAIAFCLFLLFTTFAYYFFFGFSGNGYGRWFFVLILPIVYYGCRAFDKRKEYPSLLYLSGSILAFIGTILSYLAIFILLKGKTIERINGMTYFISNYKLPTDLWNDLSRQWYLYYQLALIVVETLLFILGQKKKWLPHALFIFIAIEAVVMGNTAYAYVGLWSIENTYMGGEVSLNANREMANLIKENDDSFYRAYFDASGGSENYQYAVGLPESSSFHSLLNFEVNDFAIMNGFKSASSEKETYNGEKFIDTGWSGSYRNKRWGVDSTLGFRYYVISNQTGYPWIGENVPFGAVEMPSYSKNRNMYRVYRVSEDYLPSLGHSINKDKIYRFKVEKQYQKTNFYGSSISSRESFIHQYDISQIEQMGAIFEEDAVLPTGFNEKEYKWISSSSVLSSTYGVDVFNNGSVRIDRYIGNEGDSLLPNKSSSYSNNGVNYFFNNNNGMERMYSNEEIVAGKDHVVISKLDNSYFTSSYDGGYIEFKYYNSAYSSLDSSSYNFMPQVMVFGDKKDENGNIIQNQLLCYDYVGMKNIAGIKKNSWSNSTIGLYAKGGKVKNIVLYWPKYGNSLTHRHKAALSTINFVVEDYSLMQNKISMLKNGSLLNVKKSVNSYSFSSNYNEDQIVVTQLGFDKGWSVKAKLEDGSYTNCQTYKLDGGLFGFFAPKGNNTYVMQYKTINADLGLYLGLASLFIYISYAIYCHYEKKKKHMEFSVFSNMVYFTNELM